MITLFDESHRRHFSIKIDVRVIDKLKKAEALGIWIYIRSYNVESTIEADKIKSHFGLEDETLNDALDYLAKENLIRINSDKKMITAFSLPERKEHNVPIQVSNKPKG